MDSQLETMYTVEEVAERARRTQKAIRQLRARKRGPRFRRIDGRLLCVHLLANRLDMIDWESLGTRVDADVLRRDLDALAERVAVGAHTR